MTHARLPTRDTCWIHHKAEYLQPIGVASWEFYGQVTPAANTLIVVQSLALPEFLVEIEVTAQTD